ncbi:alpha/beta hydrolase family protein, partial [Kineococcus indalonis]|uniref:alpha/beta hydrolase family protein n=1 Tax=Kineococcus indalonis TaxID=2696566 RepID=UPI001411C876
VAHLAAPVLAQALGAAPAPEGLGEDRRSEMRYGAHRRQVADLWLPAGDRRDALVVLVHGGGWGPDVDRRDVNALVADLVGDGWPVLNADYRGVGDGGGWTSTFTDVASAVDLAARAADEHGLPADRVALAGHSAGGHLAVWAAARHRLPAGAPGADPLVVPAVVASMAGVLNPTALGGDGGDPNVTALFGGPPGQVDERYALGDPTRLVPLGVPSLVLHGSADETVPPWQSQAFADAAGGAGDEVVAELLEGLGHADALDPSGETWAWVRGWLGDVLG